MYLLFFIYLGVKYASEMIQWNSFLPNKNDRITKMQHPQSQADDAVLLPRGQSQQLKLDLTCSLVITSSGHQANHFITPIEYVKQLVCWSSVWQLSCRYRQGLSSSCHVYSSTSVWCSLNTHSWTIWTRRRRRRSPSHTLCAFILCHIRLIL